MNRSSQSQALAVLFAFLAAGFAGVAWTAGNAAAGNARLWAIVVAAAALAAWMGSLALHMLRRH